jgi:hypothetical protein
MKNYGAVHLQETTDPSSHDHMLEFVLTCIQTHRVAQAAEFKNMVWNTFLHPSVIAGYKLAVRVK